jgi:muramoyltetrapeptide carboxypeptidase
MYAPKLKKGDKVALLTPASHVDEAKWQIAIKNVHRMGLLPVYTQATNQAYGYLGGTDSQRSGDFNQAVANPAIKAIWFVRGGYGAARMVDDIDFELLKNHPKIIIGYSDITYLLHAIYKKTELVCYHGTMAGAELTDYSKLQLENTFFNADYSQIEAAGEHLFEMDTWNPGAVKGTLIGGNLSLITSLLATPYDISWKNKIVFIEEVAEKPYRIDRMFQQLKQAGKLKQASAFILGQFNQCKTSDWNLDLSNSFELDEILEFYFKSLNVPVLYNFSLGHIPNQAVLPFGQHILLKDRQKSLFLDI